MTRLWDKGAPLDERVLAYTAGEDHALDERLVAYDVARVDRARRDARSAQSCSSAADLEAIRSGLCRDRRRARARRVADRARRRGRPDRAREAADRADRRRRRSRASRPLAQRPGADGAAALPARRRRSTLAQATLRSPTRSTRWRSARARSRCPATRTCSRPCRARWRCGPAVSPPSCATTPRACGACSAASTAARSARPPATARRACRSTAKPRAPQLGLRRGAGAGDRGAALARQGRGAAAVRDHAA